MSGIYPQAQILFKIKQHQVATLSNAQELVLEQVEFIVIDSKYVISYKVIFMVITL